MLCSRKMLQKKQITKKETTKQNENQNKDVKFTYKVKESPHTGTFFRTKR